MIELYLWIAAVLTQTVNPTAELAIPTGITTTKAKVEIETQSTNVAKTSKSSI